MLQRGLRAVTAVGGTVALAGAVKEFFIYDVDAGTRAVIFDKVKGLQMEVVGEGTHLKIPFIQVPVIIDIRCRAKTIHTQTGTKDLQMVSISLRLLSRPKEDMLPMIYKTLGIDFDERVLPSVGNEVLKSVVARYNAEELLSKRELVSAEIRKALVERISKYNLVLDDVAIVNLKFGAEFSKAIENKQVAQQEAETQTYVVAKADQERKAAIIRAEGEAEAAELISKAMIASGTGMIEVRRIDTAKEVAAILSKGSNVTYLPSSDKGGANMLLSVGNSKP
eukprot:gene27350-36114_t